MVHAKHKALHCKIGGLKNETIYCMKGTKWCILLLAIEEAVEEDNEYRMDQGAVLLDRRGY